MPYKHAGEIGDVWKHLPLCDILRVEKPMKYHESNSAYSGYTISANPNTEYGVLKLLKIKNDEFISSEYYRTLKKNGIDILRYTGSPGLAMEILSNNARFFLHDIEQEALDDVEAYAKHKGIQDSVKTYCGDSIQAFIDEDYLIGEDDFIFLDPYTPFDTNVAGHDFFDIFNKAVTAGSKALLWYGYDSLNGQQRIFKRLERIAKERKIEIWSFDAWQTSMDTHGCEINPGVPGCGLACAYLSNESISILKEYLEFVGRSYSDATYRGNKAALSTLVGIR